MKKTLTMVLAFALVFALGVGGTLAWLTASTGEVKNTFTVGDIQIDLKEHDYVYTASTGVSELDTTKEVTENTDYHYVPGDTLPKDPFVTVKADSEACYLFVKATETNNVLGAEKIINWNIDTTEGWQAVEGQDNLWVINVPQATANTGDVFNIIANQQVTVNQNVTKTTATVPTLTFEAFAHQSDNTDLATATQAAINHFAQ